MQNLQSTYSGPGSLLEPRKPCRAVGMLTNRKSIDLMRCNGLHHSGHYRHLCPGWRGLPFQGGCAASRAISGRGVGAEAVCCELEGLEGEVGDLPVVCAELGECSRRAQEHGTN